jgi:hypothetical protein
MKFYLYKEYTTENEQGVSIPKELEFPDICKSEDEVMITFIDVFKHHLGRKPTSKQIKNLMESDIVYAKSGNIKYRFYIGKDI